MDSAVAISYRVTDDSTRGYARYMTLEVDAWNDSAATTILADLQRDLTDEGGYFVTIDCSTGGTSGAANRLASARFAVGTKGRAATGLADGQLDLQINEGRTCPVILPAGAPGSLTAQDVVDEFRTRGLPVANDRDNSGNCASLGCTQMITTDDITVVSWPSPESAAQYMTAFGDSAHLSGAITLSYAAARTPEGARPAYESALAEIQVK